MGVLRQVAADTVLLAILSVSRRDWQNLQTCAAKLGPVKDTARHLRALGRSTDLPTALLEEVGAAGQVDATYDYKPALGGRR